MPGNENRLPHEFPLVGRKSELESLFTLFGEGPRATRLRLLAGESGVGKSRLALTVAAAHPEVGLAQVLAPGP